MADVTARPIGATDSSVISGSVARSGQYSPSVVMSAAKSASDDGRRTATNGAPSAPTSFGGAARQSSGKSDSIGIGTVVGFAGLPSHGRTHRSGPGSIGSEHPTDRSRGDPIMLDVEGLHRQLVQRGPVQDQQVHAGHHSRRGMRPPSRTRRSASPTTRVTPDRLDQRPGQTPCTAPQTSYRHDRLSGLESSEDSGVAEGGGGGGGYGGREGIRGPSRLTAGWPTGGGG